MSKKPKQIDLENIPPPSPEDMAEGDRALKRMLHTKPKQHKDMVGQTKPDARKKSDKPK